MEILSQLHPRLVHFPIVLFTLYFFFELFGVLLKKDFLNKSAYIILILGIFFSSLAVLTGNQAHEAVKKIILEKYNYIDSVLNNHEFYATVTLWYFLAVLIFRTYLLIKKKFNGKIQFAFILLGLIGLYFILMTGLIGGSLVFDYGVGTGLFGK